MQKPNRSKVSSRNTGAKVPSQPLFKLVMIEAQIHVETNQEGVAEKKLEFYPLKSTPLMRGINRDTAKRCCDVVQEQYDRECKPVRVYVHVINDPCATYAGLAGATK